MKKEDISQVQHVAKVSWNDTYEGIIPEDVQNKFLESSYSKKSLMYRLENSHLWVAEVDGVIVGFANYSYLKKNGDVELGAIYLLPNYQGRGIGSALLQTGLSQINGMKRLILNVEKANEKALQFYKRKGFKFDLEFSEIFYGHVLNTIRMVLDVKNVAQ